MDVRLHDVLDAQPVLAGQFEVLVHVDLGIDNGRDAISRVVPFLGEQVPFGTDLVFEATNVEGFRLHAEICDPDGPVSRL